MEDALRQVQKQFDSEKLANPLAARSPRTWFEHALDFKKGDTWAVTIGSSEASGGWQFCASKTYGQTDSSEEVRKVFQLDGRAALDFLLKASSEESNTDEAIRKGGGKGRSPFSSKPARGQTGQVFLRSSVEGRKRLLLTQSLVIPEANHVELPEWLEDPELPVPENAFAVVETGFPRHSILCDETGEPFTARQLLSFFSRSELQVRTAGKGAGDWLEMKTTRMGQSTPWRKAGRQGLTRLLLTKLSRHNDLPKPQLHYDEPQMVTRRAKPSARQQVQVAQANLEKKQKLATQSYQLGVTRRPHEVAGTGANTFNFAPSDAQQEKMAEILARMSAAGGKPQVATDRKLPAHKDQAYYHLKQDIRNELDLSKMSHGRSFSGSNWTHTGPPTRGKWTERSYRAVFYRQVLITDGDGEEVYIYVRISHENINRRVAMHQLLASTNGRSSANIDQMDAEIQADGRGEPLLNPESSLAMLEDSNIVSAGLMQPFVHKVMTELKDLLDSYAPSGKSYAGAFKVIESFARTGDSSMGGYNRFRGAMVSPVGHNDILFVLSWLEEPKASGSPRLLRFYNGPFRVQEQARNRYSEHEARAREQHFDDTDVSHVRTDTILPHNELVRRVGVHTVQEIYQMLVEHYNGNLTTSGGEEWDCTELLGRPRLTRWEYKRAGAFYYEGGAGSSRWECALTAASEGVSLRTPTGRSELLAWLDMIKRDGKWHARMYGDDSDETYYNLEGAPVTGNEATNLMLLSITEGTNGGVGWPYKDCQDVSADVMEWVMHEVGAKMGFTGRNNTFRGAGHNGKTLDGRIGIFDAWSLAVLPEGVLESLRVGSGAGADDSGMDDSSLSMLALAAKAGMLQKGVGRGGQSGAVDQEPQQAAASGAAAASAAGAAASAGRKRPGETAGDGAAKRAAVPQEPPQAAELVRSAMTSIADVSHSDTYDGMRANIAFCNHITGMVDMALINSPNGIAPSKVEAIIRRKWAEKMVHGGF